MVFRVNHLECSRVVVLSSVLFRSQGREIPMGFAQAKIFCLECIGKRHIKTKLVMSLMAGISDCEILHQVRHP